MNTSTITDAIADRIPSRSAAASTISSTVEGLTDHLPHVELPHVDVRMPHVDIDDLSRSARRTRRAIARAVPGTSTSRLADVRSRASSRWVVMAAVVLAAAIAVVVLRRRSEPAHDERRDDWSTPRHGESRADSDAAREPATARA